MAWELPVFEITLEAGEDLSAKQYHFIEINTTTGKAEVCDGDTDNPIGVLQNKPTSGNEAHIMVVGVSKVASAAALTIGLQIGPATDGRAQSKVAGTDATEFVCGRVLEASGAAGGLAVAMIDCVAPHNAVTAN